ncbi:MAG: nicotinate-nucleotide adenylyltransferase [Nitrospiraceae bacterium]|nr:nicotinate-nucleotide adenylyltransferase [Nitrospiraceae bacterium]
MNEFKRVGIFGGTFNPVHLAHLRMAEEAAEALRMDKVIFVPAGKPPFKHKRGKACMAGTDERAAMVRLAIKGNPLFKLSGIECRNEGISYTVDTLEAFSNHGGRLFLIMGMDAFLEFHLWRSPKRILELAQLAVVSRPSEFDCGQDGGWLAAEKSPFVPRDGIKKALEAARGKKRPVSIRLSPFGMLSLINATVMDISATGIRARIRAGKSVRYLLPQSVESFIMTRNLYGKREGLGQRKEKSS